MPDEPRAGSARMVWLDALRGLAVVGVVTIHVLAGTLLQPSKQTVGGLAWLATLDAAARFSVPAFFLASGLLLTLGHQRRPLPYREFLLRRAWRVVPAYLSWSAIYTVSQGQTESLGGFLSAFLRHCLVGDASFHTWFVPVILHLYLVHPVLVKGLGKLLQSRRLATAGIAALVLVRLAIAIHSIPYTLPASLPQLLTDYLRNGPLAALHWSAYFVAGMLAAAWWIDAQPESPRASWLPAIGGIALAAAIVLRINGLRAAQDLDHAVNQAVLGWDTLTTVLAAWGGVALFGWLLQRPGLERTSALLSRLGPLSYGLYLGHVVVLQQVSRAKLFMVLSLIAETAIAAILLTLLLTIGLVGLLARIPGLRAVVGVERPAASTDNIVRH